MVYSTYGYQIFEFSVRLMSVTVKDMKHAGQGPQILKIYECEKLEAGNFPSQHNAIPKR